jgi:hypothetical protein
MTDSPADRCRHPVLYGPAVELEVLEERPQGEALVSVCSSGPARGDLSPDNGHSSVGMFPAPEPWLRPVLPL